MPNIKKRILCEFAIVFVSFPCFVLKIEAIFLDQNRFDTLRTQIGPLFYFWERNFQQRNDDQVKNSRKTEEHCVIIWKI